MDNWNEFYSWLERRGGVGHVRDGLRFGISAPSVRGQWRRRRWPMPYPGVVQLPGADPTFERAVLAATTWVQQPVTVTGTSALRLHGVVDTDPLQATLVVPHTRRNRWRPEVVVHRSELGDIRQTRELRGMSVADVPWSIRDHVAFGGRERPRSLVIPALQRHKTSLDGLVAAALASPTAPGVPELLELFEAIRRDQVDSGIELDTRTLLRGKGYHPWPRPFPFRCPDTRVIHLDVPIPEIWFAIECDDPSTHGTGRAFYIDRTRWNQAIRGGWRLAFVWRERLVDDPMGILEEVADAFATADPDRPPPVPAHECGKGCPRA